MTSSCITLTGLLPLPLDATPEAPRHQKPCRHRQRAALRPVSASMAGLALSFACSVPSLACSVAQCLAARTQAEAMVRLLRQHADDSGPVMRLNAPYGSMARTSLFMHARLMRVRALRQKWDAIDGLANAGARTLPIAGRSMLGVADPDAEPLQTTRPEAAPVTTRVEAPAACVDQRIAGNVSENETKSHVVAFETELSEQPWNRVSKGSGETALHEGVREAMAGLRSPVGNGLRTAAELPPGRTRA